MKQFVLIIGCFLLIACFAGRGNAVEKPANTPQVKIETSLGDIVVEFNPAAAPKTVDNFLSYVKDGFYNKTIFHRVIKGFMIQGGGFTKTMHQKSTQSPVINEADNGLHNLRGTIAMARTADPHSATSQFFINTVDNGFLDFKTKTSRGWGYCVFGKVVKGMDVVDAIEKQSTTTKGMFRDVPVTPVMIKKMVVLNQSETKSPSDTKESKPVD